jgi:type IV secretion system protein VirB10
MSEEPTAPSDDDIAKTLRLRGDPPRVMRLSRRAIIVLGGLTAMAVTAASVIALRPPAHRSKAQDQSVNTASHTPSEVITGAPKDYDQTPRLGPPLPGDLGRPIVSAQARGVDVPPPTMGASASPATSSLARQPARPSQAAIDRQAAQTSGLLVNLGGRAASPTPAPSATTYAGPAPLPGTTVEPAAGASQAAKRAFLARGAAESTTSDARLAPPVSPYVLQAGSVIPAALITGIRSDLPGQVTAQVTQDVYDSPTGRLLLIPQGSRLVGAYDSEVGFGQSRVLLVWTRLILPGGLSLVLDREPGADPQGFAGLQDQVNHHWGQIARATGLSSLLGVTSELGSNDDSDIARALRGGVQDTLNQTGQQMVRRQLDVQPTLTIRPGHPVRVMVTRDLVLEPQALERQP